jgi:DNA-binding transcriptional MocR family regulator
MSDLKLAVTRYFPKDTKVSHPDGGLNLWVQLNDSIDTEELYKEALLENILVVPGSLYSVSGKFRSCLRLGCGYSLDEKRENAIQTLGQIIYDLM